MLRGITNPKLVKVNMEPITIDQFQSVISTLLANVNSSQIDFNRAGLQDGVIRDPVGAGQRFTAFINNGCRLIIGEPKIIRIADPRFNPTEFIGSGRTIWKGPADGDGLEGEEELDKRSLVLTEADLSAALFESCLKNGESSIKGEEKLKRLRASGNVQFGGNVFLALWHDYQSNKENSCLEWLWRNRKISWMSFFGLVLRFPLGNRYVLSLSRIADEWFWSYDWLGDAWSADCLSAGLAKSVLKTKTL